ncbi:MAG: VirB3 family type IV secretion system protein [Synergistaceae bacterium]|jgi:type IV secretory pathway TrbD component|nr:VirB3 family type IV secretion system protein [Synergistaceae bacterium]
MEERLRIIPIHRSLVRPQLLMGCERFLFLMLCMVVTLLAGPGGLMTGNFINIFAAGALFFAGRALLAGMAKADARMSDVFRRSVRYRDEYPAIGTAGYRNVPKPRRWK